MIDAQSNQLVYKLQTNNNYNYQTYSMIIPSHWNNFLLQFN